MLCICNFACALCRKRDPGSAPNVGDRVAYVIIQAAKVCGWLSACACTLLRAESARGCFDGGVVSVAQWLVCVWDCKMVGMGPVCRFPRSLAPDLTIFNTHAC
jgi:hypothetical protein